MIESISFGGRGQVHPAPMPPGAGRQSSQDPGKPPEQREGIARPLRPACRQSLSVRLWLARRAPRPASALGIGAHRQHQALVQPRPASRGNGTGAGRAGSAPWPSP